MRGRRIASGPRPDAIYASSMSERGSEQPLNAPADALALILRLTLAPAVAAFMEDEHPALPNVDARRLVRRDVAENREENARHPAMRDHDAVPAKVVQKRADARGEDRVALAAGRHEAPFVGFAGAGALGITVADLLPGQAFPVAEGELLEPCIEPIAGRRQAEGRAYALHRLSRTPERARDIVETPVMRDKRAQPRRGFLGLHASEVVER